MDDRERLLDINQRALDLFGLERDEIMKRSINEVWPEWDNLKSFFIAHPDRGNAPVQFPDSSIYSVSISMLRDWRDQILGQIILLQDVTAYKRRTDEISALLDVNNLVSSTLDLNQVLYRLAGKLLEVSMMQKCTIAEWDPGIGQLRYLVEHSESFWPEPGEPIGIVEFPIIKRVLVTGQSEILKGGTENRRKQWALRKGVRCGVLCPLFSGNEIVGFVELGAVRDDEIHEEDIERCQGILLTAAEWLVSPLRFNHNKSLLALVKTLIMDGWGSYATIYEWDKSLNNINRVIDYSEMVWSQDDGPTHTLDNWPIAERVLFFIRAINFFQPRIKKTLKPGTLNWW